MNKIDFSQLGGYPLAQDTLEFMQDSTALLHKWFTMKWDDPDEVYEYVALAGVIPNATLDQWSPGWISYQGEIFYFPGGAGGAGDDFGVDETATPLIFHDLVSKNVIKVRVANFLTSPEPFPPLAAIKTYPKMLGERAAEDWVQTHVAGLGGTANISGDIYTMQNNLTRTLHIRGTLTVAAANNLPTNPVWTTITHISYAGSFQRYFDTPFKANVDYIGGFKQDSAGIQYITDLNGLLEDNHVASGADQDALKIAFIKPGGGVTNYSCSFYFIVSLGN